MLGMPRSSPQEHQLLSIQEASAGGRAEPGPSEPPLSQLAVDELSLAETCLWITGLKIGLDPRWQEVETGGCFVTLFPWLMVKQHLPVFAAVWLMPGPCWLCRWPHVFVLSFPGWTWLPGTNSTFPACPRSTFKIQVLLGSGFAAPSATPSARAL